MLGAGLEPAWNFVPRDFKSLASTRFAIRAIARQARDALQYKNLTQVRDQTAGIPSTLTAYQTE